MEGAESAELFQFMPNKKNKRGEQAPGNNHNRQHCCLHDIFLPASFDSVLFLVGNPGRTKDSIIQLLLVAISMATFDNRCALLRIHNSCEPILIGNWLLQWHGRRSSLSWQGHHHSVDRQTQDSSTSVHHILFIHWYCVFLIQMCYKRICMLVKCFVPPIASAKTPFCD